MRAIFAIALAVVCAPALMVGQTVQSFTLMNADTDQPVQGYDPIPSGITLNLATLPTKNLNIRANTNPSVIGSVRFVYGGVTKTETAAPYAMAGDISGNYNAWTPAAGAFSVTATGFSGANASGTAGAPLTLNLNVVNVSPTSSYSVSVTNGTGGGSYTAGASVTVTANPAPTGKTFSGWTSTYPLPNPSSATNTFSMPAQIVTLTANYTDASGSYKAYIYNGTGTGNYTAGSVVNITANAAPLGQVFDRWTGDVRFLSSVTAASTGFPMPATTIWITATYKAATATVSTAVTGLTLVNADTGAPIAGFDPILSGTTLNLATLPTRRLNIRANTNPTSVGSVKFVYTGGTRVEETAPYAMTGRTSSTVYNAWTPAVGSFTVTATPYDADAASGTPGTAKTVSFSVIDSSTGSVTPPPPPPTSGIPEEKNGQVIVEAENFVSQEKTTNRRWYLTSTTQTPTVTPDGDPNHAATASGGAYIEILPDTRRSHTDQLISGVNYSDAPGQVAIVKYSIKFNTPGRYYVWARIFSTTPEDNGMHVGVNGTWPASGMRMQWCNGKNTWYWNSAQRTAANHCGDPGKIWIDIPTAGTHTVQFSMREDGIEFDKFLLTTNPALPRPTN